MQFMEWVLVRLVLFCFVLLLRGWIQQQGSRDAGM